MTNDPEKQKVYYSRWKKRHPRKYKLSRWKSNNTTRFGGLKDAVLFRDHYMCVKCNTTHNLTVDHIDRNRRNNTMNNLQTLCASCHGLKDGQAREITSGWHFRRSQ